MTTKWGTSGVVAWAAGNQLNAADLNDTIEDSSPELRLWVDNMIYFMTNASLNGTKTFNTATSIYADIIAEDVTITNSVTITCAKSRPYFIICDTFQIDAGSILTLNGMGAYGMSNAYGDGYADGLIAGGGGEGGSGHDIVGDLGVDGVAAPVVTADCKRLIMNILLQGKIGGFGGGQFTTVMGGAGGARTGDAVAGGNGGGCLFIICKTATINGTIRAIGNTGAAGGAASAGAGGGGGGIIAIYSETWSGTGTINVSGGGGGAGTATGVRKGGGGGAGGLILRVRKSSGDTAWSGTLTVAGGTGGAGTGGGAAGANGSAGVDLSTYLVT